MVDENYIIARLTTMSGSIEDIKLLILNYEVGEINHEQFMNQLKQLIGLEE